MMRISKEKRNRRNHGGNQKLRTAHGLSEPIRPKWL
jgi:hypothetical protein